MVKDGAGKVCELLLRTAPEENLDTHQPKKVMVVIGTRPEAIKLAPVVLELERHPADFETQICVTGQHREMLDQMLRVFGLRPDYDLGVMKAGQDLAEVTAACLTGLDRVLRDERPDLVLVQGDTTTTLAASLAAYYYHIPVGHVEAGLRTGKKHEPFPEEINRRLASHLSDFHFAPTEVARNNLLREGISPENISVTGNTVIDALLFTQARLAEEPSLAVDQLGSTDGLRIILVTAHRRESFGAPFRRICEAIRALAERRRDVLVVYPVHLNPNVQAPVREILDGVPNVKLLAPLDYVSFVGCMQRAHILLTDSGGIQEEGPSLGKPVLVMREVSERPEAIAAGTAWLTGKDPEGIIGAAISLLDDPACYKRMTSRPNPYGDGHAAERIVQFLISRMCCSLSAYGKIIEGSLGGSSEDWAEPDLRR
jgi:UDP-N-acetylglucosamine 2-epimerase (non-hydrolysing)